uniref:Peroxiredoxin-like 2A n=1 Tax=Piliocolobus tephrosceles TaxID=591936 RepID=A0A8C9HWC7_9PRIM
MEALKDPSFFIMGDVVHWCRSPGGCCLGIAAGQHRRVFVQAPESSTGVPEGHRLENTREGTKDFESKGATGKKWSCDYGRAEARLFPCLEEVADLSSLKHMLDELGVPLYAVVKEHIRTEVKDFQPYFKGEIFLDEKKKFYGPQRQKMMFMGFIHLGVWYNFFRAWNEGFSGNLEREGFIHPRVFVVRSGKQDKVNLLSVLEAAKMIKPQTLASENI